MKGSPISRIYPVYLLLFVLALVGLIGYASSRFNAFAREEMEKALREDAILIRNIFPLEFLESEEKAQNFILRVTKGHASRVTIILPGGKVIADSAKPPAELENHSGRPEIRDALSGKQALSRRTSDSISKDLLYFALPLFDGSRVAAVVRTAGILQGPLKRIKELNTGIVFAGLIILLFTAAVSYLFVRKFNEPLAEIQRTAQNYAQGNLDARVSGKLHPKGLKQLGDTLNWMAGQLKARISTIILQKNELESILAGMIEAVVLLDSRRKVKSLNNAAEDIFAISRLEFIGKSVLETFRSPELDTLASETLTSPAPIERMITLYIKNQSAYIQVHASRISSAEKTAEGILLVLHDITRLKKLEELRKDFVANVSHELRTPITAIQGFVETLKDGAIREPKQAEIFLSIIENQTKRLSAIIEDLLSLSRLEQAETQIATAETEISGIIDTALDVCRPHAEDKKCRIEKFCPPSLKARINPTLIEQALINLIDNAVKYGNEGTKIRITAGEAGTDIEICVEDDGPGIPEKDVSRIFERFYRVDKTRSRSQGGTGLGLAIVKHIALAHKGSVRVESGLGTGSKFCILVPVQPSTTT